MAERYFDLTPADRAELLELASSRSGRPTHLLEKDIWVVWALDALFSSSLGSAITFKGGTTLSKVYSVINRFSEDIDLTYDIRAIDARSRLRQDDRGWITRRCARLQQPDAQHP